MCGLRYYFLHARTHAAPTALHLCNELSVFCLCLSLPASSMSDGAADVKMESPVPGLLLYKDRFDGESKAYLGRGAAGAVSQGFLVEVVGDTEVSWLRAWWPAPRVIPCVVLMSSVNVMSRCIRRHLSGANEGGGQRSAEKRQR